MTWRVVVSDWLDGLLAEAVAVARSVNDQIPGKCPFPGHFVGDDEVETLLAVEARVPLALGERDRHPAWLASAPELAWLADRLGLRAIDLGLLALALAPSLDRRYERLLGYLNDDLAQRRPTVDLALNLLCRSHAEKHEELIALPDGPLLSFGLIELLGEPDGNGPGTVGRLCRGDDDLIRLLDGRRVLPARLRGIARRSEAIRPDGRLDVAGRVESVLSRVADEWAGRQERSVAVLWLDGADEAEAECVARWIAGRVSDSCLVVEGAAAAADLPTMAPLIAREAALDGSVLHLRCVDSTRGSDIARWCALARAATSGVVISGTHRHAAEDLVDALSEIGEVLTLTAIAAGPTVRSTAWREHLQASGIVLPDRTIDDLGARFRFGPTIVARAVRDARTDLAVSARSGHPGDPGDAVWRAARRHAAAPLAGLAQRVQTPHSWDDLVVPGHTRSELLRIIEWVKHSPTVGDAGFRAHLGLRAGVSVLFAGASGTGKTMAAGLIAREIGLDLYAIDLAQVVSKYIGETEQNLDRVFRAAEGSSAVLFFDEADALFGKRSEVKDSHDRYANIEVAYLLQRMERYDGIVVLATNLHRSLDEAFTRRLDFIIRFPLPDAAARETLWRSVWPDPDTLDRDVDLDDLAARHELTAAQIRNAAIGAAHRAVSDRLPVGRQHLEDALDAEYQKLGRRGLPEFAVPGLGAGS